MKPFSKKESITPEVFSAMLDMRLVRELFKPLIPKDYRIRLVVISLVIIWAFAMAITISIYG